MIPVPTGGDTAHAANVRAWEAVLDRLERDVVAATELAGSGSVTAPEPWQPPTLIGALPDELLGRARDLHHRQVQVRSLLTKGLAETRAQQQLAQRSGARAAAPAAPAYVDVSA